MSYTYQRPDLFCLQTAREVAAEYDQDERQNGSSRERSQTPRSPATNERKVRLTKASAIRVRPVLWVWQDRIARGTLVLVGGREGIGKSICVYTLAADLTRGQLPGVYFGKKRSVIVAATEDSWEHTIVPRLMAADADLDRVHRVDVTTSETIDTLSLPKDLSALETAIRDVNAVLVVFDPLMSRLDASLDSHKDQEVRQALEPLVAVADRTGSTLAGLIHVNKSHSDDPLTTLMASRAFAAVARSVLFVMSDPDQEGTRLLGLAKNNLGRSDLPVLRFRINGEKVAETVEGDVWTGKLEWTGESNRTIREALQASVETAGCNRLAVSEAADWLTDYLASKDRTADSADIKRDGKKAGHSEAALHRARLKLQIGTKSLGFPRRTHWTLPATVVSPDGESQIAETTATTEAQSFQSLQSSRSPQDAQRVTAADRKPFVFDGEPT